MGSKEGSVHTRYLNSGHGTAWLLPDLVYQLAPLVKEQTGVSFLRGDQQMALSLILEGCDPIAQYRHFRKSWMKLSQ